MGGKAEGQGFAVERSETTLKPVRTPVVRTLRVLNVSALRASTFETHLRFPCKSFSVPKSPSQSDLARRAFLLSPPESL